LVLVAVAVGSGLAGCDKPAQQPAASAPPVTVAQPTKRTVTDWDEFTGRFDAVEQVQVRARVTGFVTGVEFKDGAMVKTGDLLYTIDPRQYEAVAEQARGQLADAKAKIDLAERELSRAETLVNPKVSSISGVSSFSRHKRLRCRPKAHCNAPISMSNLPR
jgi:multidrug efflux pump subunit AcrA (membrane-fusion protein)